MSKLVSVVYVGNKPFAADNVSRSGKTWAGFGDVQQVTVEQSKILIKYPDQWALGDGKNLPAQAVVQAKQLEKLGAVHEAAAKRASAHGPGGKRIEDMTREELISHADRAYGFILDGATVEDCRKQLDDVVRNEGLTAEFARNSGGESGGAGATGTFEDEIAKLGESTEPVNMGLSE